MTRKPRPRPKTPEQMAAEKAAKRRQDFGAVGMQTDAADLITNADVEIEREGQRNAERARRADAFDALKPGMAPGCYDAARRLERDILQRFGELDHGRGGERVDCTAGPTTEAMIAAGQRADKVLKLVPLRDSLLLRALIRPTIDASWRDTVKRLTAEENPHAQAAVVRGACLNLRDAYQMMERRAA